MLHHINIKHNVSCYKSHAKYTASKIDNNLIYRILNDLFLVLKERLKIAVKINSAIDPIVNDTMMQRLVNEYD